MIITAQSIIGALLSSISDVGEVRGSHKARRIPKDESLKVYNAAVWQKLQRYLLVYHQTTEYGAASFLRLWDSWTHSLLSTG